MESAEKSELRLAEEVKALKSNSNRLGSSADANFKIAELLERLMETEKSERALKEQVWEHITGLG